MRTHKLLKRHLESVMEIETLQFDHYWPAQQFLPYIKQTEGQKAEVMLDDKSRVIGYICYQEAPPVFFIENLAIDASCLRRGVGTALVRKCIARAGRVQCHIETRVRETNLNALLFFQSLGFQATEIKKEPYDGTNEDGIIMTFQTKVKI